MKGAGMARRLLAATAAGLLLLSGCGGSPSEEPTTTALPSPTKATPAAPAAPELPDAASENTKEGAIAFVQHYVEMLNVAQFGGSLRPLREASDPLCENCQSVIRRLKSIHTSGGKVIGGEWTLVKVDAIAVDFEDVHGFSCPLQVRSTRQVVRMPGKKEEVYPAGSVDYTFSVFFEHGRWRLASWQHA